MIQVTGRGMDGKVFDGSTKEISVLAIGLPAGRTIKFMVEALYEGRTVEPCLTNSIETVPSMHINKESFMALDEIRIHKCFSRL